jgi:hypothetical protein
MTNIVIGLVEGGDNAPAQASTPGLTAARKVGTNPVCQTFSGVTDTFGVFMAINRNLLIVLLVIAAGVIAVLGYRLYEEQRQPQGVDIQVGPKGLSIEKK